MTSISLQSVAYNSRATLNRLGEPGNGATIENGRIGINDKGQLVVFKGKAFLLHLRQCYRADKLIKANDLSTHESASLRSALKFKDLRLGKPSTDTLLTRMNVTNALRKIIGAPDKTVCFESFLAGMPGKILSKGGPHSPHSQASVRITTQPPMALQELERQASTTDNNAGTPVTATPPKRPPRKIDPPFLHHSQPSSDSPAFLGDLHRGGLARDALIRTMLANSGS
ncbi:hypothetical protein LXM60_13230 [Pandoraea sputorum]|uniref:hypothetical protein n=1 Tax=Pandoraea sputorum TaxID=93222 RepID=UPI001E3FB272|nr:hypothetical protein [Pandoraea sputorum]MCE4061169.1 hypothetical protein [Pandoraea sputorum]